MFAANPALVLNADFQPLSYFPLSLFNWEDALKAVVKGSHVVVAEYDQLVRSPSTVMRLRDFWLGRHGGAALSMPRHRRALLPLKSRFRA